MATAEEAVAILAEKKGKELTIMEALGEVFVEVKKN